MSVENIVKDFYKIPVVYKPHKEPCQLGHRKDQR